MKNYQNDYLSESEFEREFEFNDESYESSDEFEANNDEFEANDEYEADGENDTESDNEWEDNEAGAWGNEYNSPDREYEDRLYAALNGEYENSFEMEQEIDRVLHEMEIEYFGKWAKKAWSKHKNKLMGVAGKYLPKGTLQTLGKLAGGDMRGLLKSDLFKKGLSLAANAVAPGMGGAVVGGLLNSEVAAGNNARAQANQAVKVAKTAYQNMAQNVTNLRPGNVPAQISSMSKQALSNAKNKHSAYKGKKKRVIQIAPNSIVVVRPDRVIIYS